MSDQYLKFQSFIQMLIDLYDSTVKQLNIITLIV